MKKLKHIGWVKYCATSTAWPIRDSEHILFVKPWPCRAVFFKDKPKLEFQEDPEQFFWKKLYASHNSRL